MKVFKTKAKLRLFSWLKSGFVLAWAFQKYWDYNGSVINNLVYFYS